MTEAYDGRQIVGMDLHRHRSVLVRMTEDGRQLNTARITNSPGALRKEIARAGKNPRVVLEATYGWYWAADVLEVAGAEVHLAHPLGVKAFTYRRVKNDQKDAADLADLLRMGGLPEAWIAPREVRELREITRYRHLCRIRHKCRYAEARIMPRRLGRRSQGWWLAGEPRHNPGAVSSAAQGRRAGCRVAGSGQGACRVGWSGQGPVV